MKDHGPLDIATAEDYLAKLRAGTKEVFDIKMRALTVPVRVLSIDEMNDIRRSAKVEQQKTDGDETDFDVYRQKLTLKLASTLKGSQAPMLSDKLLGKLSVDEITYLYNEYVRVMDSVNPSLETISPEYFQALVDALKKNHTQLNELSMRDLKAICSAFVEMIRQPAS